MEEYLEKDEFKVVSNYLDSDTRQFAYSLSNSSNSNNQLNGSNTIQRDSTATRRPVNPSHFGRSYRVSTSPEDRLSLPLSMAFKGQDNSIPAFNSHHHAGSQLTVNSGELTSSNGRSKILPVVSDGQADDIYYYSRVVDGKIPTQVDVNSRVVDGKIPTQVEVANADKFSNDSRGDLSRLSGGTLSSRVVDGKIPTQVDISSRVVDGKIPTQVESAPDSLDLNAILISNNEFVSSKVISNAILHRLFAGHMIQQWRNI